MKWRIIHDTERYGETWGFRKYGPVVEFDGTLDDAEAKADEMSYDGDAGLTDQFYVDGAEEIRNQQSREAWEKKHAK